MTYPYEWNPIPHELDIRCPDCSGHAKFEFAETRQIAKADAEYFQADKLFEYSVSAGTFSQPGKKYTATYYHGLHRSNLESIQGLPDKYSSSEWEHSRYWLHTTDKGTSTCMECQKRRKSVLNWPEDAWYQVEVRGKVLWAFDRPSLIALRNYIAATERNKVRRESYTAFLLNVPTHFLTAKVRDETVKKLNQLLAK